MSRASFTPGEIVQTPLGKGVVQEVRNNGRVLVLVQGRALELGFGDIAPLGGRRTRSVTGTRSENQPPVLAPRPPHHARREVDLHGLTVEEALERAETALNDALLADLTELRFIHGRGSGRIRAALHRRLKEMAPVRSIRLDPRNVGVTIVTL